ncbi:MAG: V4R domain-containing protein [Longimicrobiales bacterium]
MSMNSRSPELVLPAASLVTLRRSLIERLGAEAASGALQQAGHAAGDAFHQLLTDAGRHDGLGEVPESDFWRRLNELLAARGWGQIEFERAHEGIGAIVASHWAESDPDEHAPSPSCFLSTGLFSNLLGHVAGRDVAVFEVECRSRGDARCRFFFGGIDTLDILYDAISRGQDVPAALASLR